MIYFWRTNLFSSNNLSDSHRFLQYSKLQLNLFMKDFHELKCNALYNAELNQTKRSNRKKSPENSPNINFTQQWKQFKSHQRAFRIQESSYIQIIRSIRIETGAFTDRIKSVNVKLLGNKTSISRSRSIATPIRTLFILVANCAFYIININNLQYVALEFASLLPAVCKLA